MKRIFSVNFCHIRYNCIHTNKFDLTWFALESNRRSVRKEINDCWHKSDSSPNKHDFDGSHNRITRDYH